MSNTYLVLSFGLVFLDDFGEILIVAIVLVVLGWPLREWKLAVCLFVLRIEIVEGREAR